MSDETKGAWARFWEGTTWKLIAIVGALIMIGYTNIRAEIANKVDEKVYESERESRDKDIKRIENKLDRVEEKIDRIIEGGHGPVTTAPEKKR